MRKEFRTILASLAAAFMIAPGMAEAAEPFDSYIYDEWKRPVMTQSGYRAQQAIELGDLSEGVVPVDFYRAKNGVLYILDASNGEILMLDKDYKPAGVMSAFEMGGQPSPLSQPSGLFVSDEGIYIADTGNSRVVFCDFKGSIKKEYTRPQTGQYPRTMDFNPKKVIADTVGNVYVLCEGGYFGAVLYDVDGKFSGFFGGNKVESSIRLVLNRFWKNLMTREQTDRFERFVPIEYTSFDIDAENSVYVCVSSKTDSANRMKKLNPSGKNILPESWFGDEKTNESGGITIETSFVDVAADDEYNMNVLDFSRKRVFQYDRDGNLMFVFGGEGNYTGTFYAPVAIETAGEDVLVLDRDTASVTRFVTTEFGGYVRSAMRLYNDGLYKEAVPAWEEVTRLSTQYPMAYAGIGKAKMLEKDYRSAMKNFKLGAEHKLYSEAYAEVRKAGARKMFPIIGVAVIAVMLGIVVLINPKSRIRRAISARTARFSGSGGTMRVMLRQMAHPIDNTDEMRWNKTGSIKIAAGILVLLVVASILQEQATGFIFNSNDTSRFNIVNVLFRTIVVFMAFVISNWSICTLLDGEGRLKEILVSAAYALLPFILCLFISVALSHFMILEEKVFLDAIVYLGAGWSVLIGILSLMVVHQYTFSKTVLSIAFSALIMVFILFLAILLFGLIQEITTFVVTIFRELLIRS